MIDIAYALVQGDKQCGTTVLDSAERENERWRYWERMRSGTLARRCTSKFESAPVSSGLNDANLFGAGVASQSPGDLAAACHLNEGIRGWRS